MVYSTCNRPNQDLNLPIQGKYSTNSAIRHINNFSQNNYRYLFNIKSSTTNMACPSNMRMFKGNPIYSQMFVSTTCIHHLYKEANYFVIDYSYPCGVSALSLVGYQLFGKHSLNTDAPLSFRFSPELIVFALAG